jgi:hypothetical protein
MALASPLFTGCDRIDQVMAGGRPIKAGFPLDDPDAVGRIQSALSRLVGPMPRSFPARLGGQPDGVYGDETRGAVIKFQRRAFPNDVREWDGIVGSKTLQAMDDALGASPGPSPGPSPKPPPAPTSKKYLVSIQGFDHAVPKGLQEGVKTSMKEALDEFDVELDFAGAKPVRDLLVELKDENPSAPIFGESTRVEVDGVEGMGMSEVFVGAMKAFRLQTGPDTCEAAFPETDAGLGKFIANATTHEIGHMLGLNKGADDGGGHTRDPDNFMFESPSTAPTKVSPFFEYTVKEGDVLSVLVEKYKRGQLDRCRFGATDLTADGVWNFPPNKDPGFIRDPNKGKTPGKIANDPNRIYVGEKIAFQSSTLRTQAYRLIMRGFLGKKTFSAEQKETINKFIAGRRAANKG